MPYDRAVVLILYSHEDSKWMNVIEQQLKILELQGLVRIWTVNRIAAGADRRREVEEAVAQAKCVIPVVSARFFDSRSLQDEIMSRVRDRHQRGDLLMIPVLARPCYWQVVPWLDNIVMYPRNGRALSGMSCYKFEAELVNIVGEIRQKVSPAP